MLGLCFGVLAMGDIIVEKVAMVKIQISGLQPWRFELVYSAVVGVVEAPPKLGLLQQDLSTQNQKQEQQTQVEHETHHSLSLSL